MDKEINPYAPIDAWKVSSDVVSTLAAHGVEVLPQRAVDIVTGLSSTARVTTYIPTLALKILREESKS